MTRTEIAPELVEEAVFLAMREGAQRGDMRAVAWFERRERHYEIADPAERQRAFREHALESFRTLHFDDPVRSALESCPAARASLDVLYLRRAVRRKDESADLYCATDRDDTRRSTRAVLSLRPERFLGLEELFEFTRRELLFVDDMLDARFGYAADAIDRLALEPGLRDVVRERVGREWRARVELRAVGAATQESFEAIVRRAVDALSCAIRD